MQKEFLYYAVATFLTLEGRAQETTTTPNEVSMGIRVVPEEIIPELYEKYREALEDDNRQISQRRLFTNDKEYEIHVRKLKEVNGYKLHNLMIGEKSKLGNTLLYVNNPIEAKLPNAYLTLEEFKRSLMLRAANDRKLGTKQEKQTVFLYVTNHEQHTVKRLKPTTTNPTVYLNNSDDHIEGNKHTETLVKLTLRKRTATNKNDPELQFKSPAKTIKRSKELKKKTPKSLKSKSKSEGKRNKFKIKSLKHELRTKSKSKNSTKSSKSKLRSKSNKSNLKDEKKNKGKSRFFRATNNLNAIDETTILSSDNIIFKNDEVEKGYLRHGSEIGETTKSVPQFQSSKRKAKKINITSNAINDRNTGSIISAPNFGKADSFKTLLTNQDLASNIKQNHVPNRTVETPMIFENKEKAEYEVTTTEGQNTVSKNHNSTKKVSDISHGKMLLIDNHGEFTVQTKIQSDNFNGKVEEFNDTILASDDTTVALKDLTVETNDVMVASDNTTVVADDTTVAAEVTAGTLDEMTFTLDDTTATADDTTVVSDETMVTSDDVTVTYDDITITSDDATFTPHDATVTSNNDMTVTFDDVSVTSNDEMATSHYVAVTTVSADESSFASDDTSTTVDNITGATEATTVTLDVTTVASKDTTVTTDETTVVSDEAIITDEDVTVTSDSTTVVADYSTVIADDTTVVSDDIPDNTLTASDDTTVLPDDVQKSSDDLPVVNEESPVEEEAEEKAEEETTTETTTAKSTRRTLKRPAVFMGGSWD